jgi:hypothetical protein
VGVEKQRSLLDVFDKKVGIYLEPKTLCCSWKNIVKFSKYSVLYQINNPGRLYHGDFLIRGVRNTPPGPFQIIVSLENGEWAHRHEGWICGWEDFLRHYKLDIVGRTDITPHYFS